LADLLILLCLGELAASVARGPRPALWSPGGQASGTRAAWGRPKSSRHVFPGVPGEGDPAQPTRVAPRPVSPLRQSYKTTDAGRDLRQIIGPPAAPPSSRDAKSSPGAPHFPIFARPEIASASRDIRYPPCWACPRNCCSARSPRPREVQCLFRGMIERQISGHRHVCSVRPARLR